MDKLSFKKYKSKNIKVSIRVNTDCLCIYKTIIIKKLHRHFDSPWAIFNISKIKSNEIATYIKITI